MTTITTEEMQKLWRALFDANWHKAAGALRSLAAERDALQAERNAERSARFKAEAEFSHMQRRIARQRRALAKLYRKRHDRKAERDHLEKTAMQAAQCHGRETLRADRLEAENARLREALREIERSHIPDQPAAFEHSDLDWARLHVGKLRSVARVALGEKE